MSSYLPAIKEPRPDAGRNIWHRILTSMFTVCLQSNFLGIKPIYNMLIVLRHNLSASVHLGAYLLRGQFDRMAYEAEVSGHHIASLYR
jgi:hypothetical protein